MAQASTEQIYDLEELRPENVIEIEAIDMSLPEQEIIPKLMSTLNTVGFFGLKNVEGFNQEELLEAVKAFYNDIPEQEHQKLIQKAFNNQNENCFVGLVPTTLNQKAHNSQY